MEEWITLHIAFYFEPRLRYGNNFKIIFSSYVFVVRYYNFKPSPITTLKSLTLYLYFVKNQLSGLSQQALRLSTASACASADSASAATSHNLQLP